MQKGLIRGFKHCSQTSLVITSKSLSHCPICNLPFEASPFLLPPFVLCKSPVFSAHASPLSLVLCSRDRSGKVQDNLHCGITDSVGTVYHYTHLGLLKSSVGWEESLTLEAHVFLPFHAHQKVISATLWNEKLLEAFNSPIWQKDNYAENFHDCFTFVCCFLSFWSKSFQERITLSKVLTEKLLNPYFKFSDLNEQIEGSDFIIKHVRRL